MTLAARTRRLYWKHIRRYRYETCGRPNHPHATIMRGCGRPVGLVWRASSPTWTYVVTDQEQIDYTIREGAGGVLCLACFDRFAQERGVHLRWESRPL